jgi:hypothetical protein
MVVACSAPAQEPNGDFLSAAPGCAPLPVLDSVRLMSDLSRLADDSLRGRLLGSNGNLKARDFIAARFDALGLGTLPFGRLQRVPVVSERLPGIEEAWNVVGTVLGTEFPEKAIVITAHFDHIGIGRAVDGDSIYNGADDNASGAVALAVLARHFMTHPTRHTLIFAAVDAEERGMYGVRGLVELPELSIDRVLLNINMDMISRNEAGELYAAGPGRYPQFMPLIKAVAECAPVTLLTGHDTEAAGPGNDWTMQSDHAAFNAKGIPFIYFGVEDHDDYHRPSDHVEGVMPGFYLGAVRTVAAAIRHADEH